MGIQDNPRPNHQLSRCCGNCKFFLSTQTGTKQGRCILPEGPKLVKNINRLKELKSAAKMSTFAKTHPYCICDNHQWRSSGYIKRSTVWAGVKMP